MKPNLHHLFRSLAGIFAILSAACPTHSVVAAVTLASFTVTGQDEAVLVEWETATELDNSGFYVWRSFSEGGTYSRISPFIPADLSDPLSGAFYEYIDYDVANGTTYWYRLESVDLDQYSEFYGPIFVIPGEPTPTRTLTLTGVATQSQTPTITPTRTGTQPFPTAASATPYPAPGATATFPVFTPLPTQPQATQPLATQPAALLPSPTLLTTPVSPTTSTVGSVVPLVQITLVFPTEGITLLSRTTPTPSPLPVVVASPPVGWSPWGGAMLIGFLVVIWLMLGSWFYFSFRRLE